MKKVLGILLALNVLSTSALAQVCSYSLNGEKKYSFRCRVITTGMQPSGVEEPISFIDNKENFDRYNVGNNYADFKQISRTCIERRLGNGDKITKVCYRQ